MTPAEYIIGGILLAMFTGVLGALLAGKNKVTLEQFDEHKKDKTPHVDCSVHEEQLKTIKEKLDKMDRKLDTLLER